MQARVHAESVEVVAAVRRNSHAQGTPAIRRLKLGIRCFPQPMPLELLLNAVRLGQRTGGLNVNQSNGSS
jgi:hypothetical protein